MSSDHFWCQSSFRAPSPLPLHHNPSVPCSLRMSSPLLSPHGAAGLHALLHGTVLGKDPTEVGSDMSDRGCPISSSSSCLEIVENNWECFPQVGSSTIQCFCNILGLKWAFHGLALVRFVCSRAHRHLEGRGLSLKNVSQGWCCLSSVPHSPPDNGIPTFCLQSLCFESSH